MRRSHSEVHQGNPEEYSVISHVRVHLNLLSAFVLLGTPGSIGSQDLACPNNDCSFAVFIMPDPQGYTADANNNGNSFGENHLTAITQYICDNKSMWTEPDTNRTMPIRAVIALGDMVNIGTVQAQWDRASRAFDRLDDPGCQVPYVMAFGNHDYSDGTNVSQLDTPGWQSTFGTNRWTTMGYSCQNDSDCLGVANDPVAGDDWFIAGDMGTADDIPVGTRNVLSPPAFQGIAPGPLASQERRHRGMVVKMPSGQRWVVLAMEERVDFETGLQESEYDPMNHVDGMLWPRAVLDAYQHFTTILATHSLVKGNLFHAERLVDSVPAESTCHSPFGCPPPIPVWGESVWNYLTGGIPNGTPHTGVRLSFNGHHNGNEGHLASRFIVDPSGPDGVADLFFRNYMFEQTPGCSNPNQPTGGGWNTIVVFDTKQAEIRIRTHRIDTDTSGGNCSHANLPATIQASDFANFTEVQIPELFPDVRPGELDNCWQPENVPAEIAAGTFWRFTNPSQNDTDCDGWGNTCDCDFDQDGFCSISDINRWLADFQTTVDSGWGTDMNSDGAVGIADWGLILAGFQAGFPGISGPDAPPDPDCTAAPLSGGGAGPSGGAMMSLAPAPLPLAPTSENQPIIDFLEKHLPDSPFLP